jgi:hypothetical protein
MDAPCPAWGAVRSQAATAPEERSKRGLNQERIIQNKMSEKMGLMQQDGETEVGRVEVLDYFQGIIFLRGM